MTAFSRQASAMPSLAIMAPSHLIRLEKRPIRMQRPSVINRVRVVMMHAPYYSFQGQARLAADAGVSRSTISRLIGGRLNPSCRLAQAITAALEKRLGQPLNLREIFSPDGTFPTASGCALTGCRGCMPEEAYDPDGNLTHEYRDARPGDWSLSKPSAQKIINENSISTGKESR